MHSKSPAVAALKAAFPHTIPIFAGFLFLGMTYGVYMRTSGFSFWYPMIMSVVIFGGSLEFVATSMLLAPFAPVQVFLTAVMIQARHLFYGISMLDKYKGTGWKKPYLIYAMCDETFSVNYTAEIPEGVDRGWFYFFVSLLDEFYWFLGATLGGILGALFAIPVLAFTTAFVKAPRYGPEGPPESPEIADAEASPDARVASVASEVGQPPEPKTQPEADSGP